MCSVGEAPGVSLGTPALDQCALLGAYTIVFLR